jgi:hypothetical protein
VHRICFYIGSKPVVRELNPLSYVVMSASDGELIRNSECPDRQMKRTESNDRVGIFDIGLLLSSELVNVDQCR